MGSDCDAPRDGALNAWREGSLPDRIALAVSRHRVLDTVDARSLAASVVVSMLGSATVPWLFRLQQSLGPSTLVDSLADASANATSEQPAPEDSSTRITSPKAAVDHRLSDLRRRFQTLNTEPVLRSLEAGQLWVLTPQSRLWPEKLNGLGGDTPQILWGRGDPDLVTGREHRVLAVVGARAATPYGQMVAHAVLEGESRFTIVSGSAYGIDAFAHRVALDGNGSTVAVLASGVDVPTPAGHTELLRRIADHGAIVSEHPPGTRPRREGFLRRNRVIAALADATLVLEAGPRSGALNTAGHAAALGRPLGSVPGPISSVAYQGCHRLLREYDAQCVATHADVLELLNIEPAVRESPSPRDEHRVRHAQSHSRSRSRTSGELSHPQPTRTPTEQRILERVRQTPGIAPDEVHEPGVSSAERRVALAALELQGALVHADGRWWPT